jgi:glucokinase-like ROK family protein
MAYQAFSHRSNVMPQKQAAISIDLGGTNLRMGVVDSTPTVVHWQQDKTPTSKQGIIDLIISNVRAGLDLAQSDGFKVLGVGVSSGGRVNNRSGVIVDSTSLLPDWKDVHIKETIEKSLNVPVAVDNDGNCSAVAEKVFGKAKSLDNFISIALGTGIGGGIYVDGKLLRGENNYAAEIGHVTVNADGPKCACGGYGCVELYASGSGLVRWAKAEFPLLADPGKGHELSAKSIGDSARSGDVDAIKILNKAGKMLGAAAAGWVNIFNPSKLVLSGSLVDLGEPYFGPFRKTVLEHAIKPTADYLGIIFSDFHEKAGIIGAASLVFQG